MIEHFIFTGWRNDIPSILSACDLLLFLPQKPEGFGRPLIEGMAAGLPIITTNIGPSFEICTGRCAGFIPAQNDDLLAKEIIRLINDRTTQKKMGQAGKERVREKFLFKQLFPKYKLIYENQFDEKRNC